MSFSLLLIGFIPVRCSKMVHNVEALVTMNVHGIAVTVLAVLSG